LDFSPSNRMKFNGFGVNVTYKKSTAADVGWPIALIAR
jgi:hypothetical protein